MQDSKMREAADLVFGARTYLGWPPVTTVFPETRYAFAGRVGKGKVFPVVGDFKPAHYRLPRRFGLKNEQPRGLKSARHNLWIIVANRKCGHDRGRAALSALRPRAEIMRASAPVRGFRREQRKTTTGAESPRILCPLTRP